MRARTEIAAQEAAVERALRRGTPAELRVSEKELRNLVLVWLADQDAGAKILARTRDIRVAIGESELEVGLEILLDERSLEQLEGDGREGIERLLRQLPLLLGGELYLAVRGAPVAKNGSLAVTGEPQIQLGALTLSLRAVAEQIGVSAAWLEEELLLEIDGYSVEEVRVEESSLVLTVKPG